MRISETTIEYLNDRIERIMISKTFKEVLENATSEQIKEVTNTLLWHLNRTLNDQRSQLKFVFRKKTPEIAETANLVVNGFHMHLLKYKALNINEKTNEE